jgi:hypothetical protein
VLRHPIENRGWLVVRVSTFLPGVQIMPRKSEMGAGVEKETRWILSEIAANRVALRLRGEAE